MKNTEEKMNSHQKEIAFINKALEKYNIDSSSEDVFLHGFGNRYKIDNIEETSKSFFEKGVKIQNHGHVSIFSTLCLCNKELPLDKQIEEYIPMGRYRAIVHIPKSLENVFFGISENAFGNSMNKDGDKCLLDLLKFEYLPPEFIVGIYYTDKVRDYEDEDIKPYFIENPNYFAHPTNSKKNTKSLLNKIHEAIENATASSIVKNLMCLDTEFNAGLIIKYCDSLDKDKKEHNFPFFALQRMNFDNSKNDVLTQ